jgi:hypothetical protein
VKEKRRTIGRKETKIKRKLTQQERGRDQGKGR